MEQRVKAPHSTLERIGLLTLPVAVYHLLFSQSEGLPWARLLLRAVFGAVSGAGLYLGLIYNLPVTFHPKLAVGCIFIALCVLGGLFFSSFRASILLIFPSMLGSRGRSYLLIYTLSALYSGPLSNIQRNVQSVALSLGCNLDLQLNHSRLLWRSSVQPLISMGQQVMEEKVGFQEEALDISRAFQQIRDEVIAQYGYSKFKANSSANSTQDQFTTKTLLQCDTVVEQGVERCRNWFVMKWQDCVDTISVAIISNILCMPMKFYFLCDVMRVMIPWCREEIPVEGNFGQTFDKLKMSIDMLSREFTTDLVLEQEEQQVLLGDFQGIFVAELTSSLQQAQDLSSRILETLQILLSLTFITIFTGAFGYVHHYRKDIFFDNTYITTYFRQIDARRKAARKHFLLPLNRAERTELINPWSPLIRPCELQELSVSLLQVVCLGALVCVLLAVDLTLSHMLDILHAHTFTEFNLTSHQHVDIRVGGDSMMARLLRKTISAFNSSSHLQLHTSNQHCMPQSTALQAMDYTYSTAPVLLMAAMCCLQVYSNRLRRAIAAFYYPKWDKRRALFLYNFHIQNRLSFIARHRSQLATRVHPHTQGLPRCVQVVLERLGCRCRLSWCCVCGERGCGGQGSEVCPSPGCEAVFCVSCWDYLGHLCPCRHSDSPQQLDPQVAHDDDFRPTPCTPPSADHDTML